MAFRERNSALHWAATRPEGNTPAVAVAVGHFVQVGQHPAMPCPGQSDAKRPNRGSGAKGTRSPPSRETTLNH